MAHYQVTLSYDGTEFKGYQRQGIKRTVQGCVEEALRKLGWTATSIVSAGRTDTGVHASGQVITFDLDWNHPMGEILCALNTYLPADISARKIQEAAPDFHPRFDAKSREYRYRVLCETIARSSPREVCVEVRPTGGLFCTDQFCSSDYGRTRFYSLWNPAPGRKRYDQKCHPIRMADGRQRAQIHNLCKCLPVPHGTQTGICSGRSSQWTDRSATASGSLRSRFSGSSRNCPGLRT